ncbi:MAG TPA: hypothetical protein VGR20_22705 [Acidimicrobiia bacterium]|nr:hypothetical protein [Acidimicrobiia bacterium]
MRLCSTRPTVLVRCLAGAAAVALVVGAPAAYAHEEIAPKTFPTGQPTFLTLTAANEASVNLVRIVLHAPAGLAFGETTRSPAGWAVTRTDDTITWTGGVVKPDAFETWGYEIEGADQPGTLAYKVTLGYADGKSDDIEVDVNAVAPAAASTGTTVSTGSTGATASPTTGAAAPVGSGDDSTTGGSDGDSDGASGTAKAALAVSIVALLTAAGALVAGGRRRGPGASGGGGAAGGAQDW